MRLHIDWWAVQSTLQAMENLTGTDKRFSVVYRKSIQGGSLLPKTQLIILCLALLNAILLIAAVIIGVNCAKVKHETLHTSNSAVTELIDELNYLRSNHSDVIGAEEDVKKTLQRAVNDHSQLKVQIQQLTTMNDDFQSQLEKLRREKTSLQSNMSTMADSCGKCPYKWLLRNSSCYFFSSVETSPVKKNWNDSRADCIARGADLVVIDNPEEQKFVSNVVQSQRGQERVSWQQGYWMGLTDTETEGTWIWVNNVTEVEQRYWADGEPNNHGNNEHGEDCLIVVYRSTNPWKTWYDGKCTDHKFDWICEKPSA